MTSRGNRAETTLANWHWLRQIQRVSVTHVPNMGKKQTATANGTSPDSASNPSIKVRGSSTTTYMASSTGGFVILLSFYRLLADVSTSRVLADAVS